jgi:hypothetical protein
METDILRRGAWIRRDVPAECRHASAAGPPVTRIAEGAVARPGPGAAAA